MSENHGVKAGYRMVGRVVVRRIGADCLLVPVTGEASGDHAVFPVNETGVMIWEQLADGRTTGEIAALLSERYGIEQQQATRDCEEFIDELVREGLLERVEDAVSKSR